MTLTIEDLNRIENTLQERIQKIRDLPAYSSRIVATMKELQQMRTTLDKIQDEIARIQQM